MIFEQIPVGGKEQACAEQARERQAQGSGVGTGGSDMSEE